MKYFAYGMNTNLNEMFVRCPGSISLGPARVDNYKFVFRNHADIEKSAGDMCYGVLWDITPEHLKSLDALEGYPYYYTRFRVRVNLGDRFVYAITYQMNDQSYINHPSQGYLEMVTEGYQQNGVPTYQIGHAINMVCSLSNVTKMDFHNTWLPMTPVYV